MKYNLRGEERESKSAIVRDKAEHKVMSFLRYFVPAMGPLVIYIAAEALMVIVGSTLIHPKLTHAEFREQKMNLYMMAGVILTFILLRIYSKKRSSTFFEDASLYLKEISVVKTVGCILFGFGISVSLSAFITLLPKIGPVATYSATMDRLYHTWSLYVAVLFNTFFTPIVEEVIFRGYMLNRLLPHWGEKKSLFAVSLLFALMHGTALWMLYAFAMAWVIGRVSIYEDNIFYAICVHMGFNLFSTILWFIYLFRPEMKDALSQNIPLILMLGVSGGAIALLVSKLYRAERENLFVTRFFQGKV